MQLTSSEYEDLVNDVVSSEGSMQLKLADLEAKLEIISPEDLTVSWQGTAGSVCFEGWAPAAVVMWACAVRVNSHAV
jgi:hypothetical protein